MTHDPLCPNKACTCDPDDYGHDWSCGMVCQCDLIAKVRADQDRKHREEMQSLVLAARNVMP